MRNVGYRCLKFLGSLRWRTSIHSCKFVSLRKKFMLTAVCSLNNLKEHHTNTRALPVYTLLGVFVAAGSGTPSRARSSWRCSRGWESVCQEVMLTVSVAAYPLRHLRRIARHVAYGDKGVLKVFRGETFSHLTLCKLIISERSWLFLTPVELRKTTPIFPTSMLAECDVGPRVIEHFQHFLERPHLGNAEDVPPTWQPILSCFLGKMVVTGDYTGCQNR